MQTVVIEQTRTHHDEDFTMTTTTIALHRVLRSSPARIYQAFLNPNAYAKWLPPNGYFCTVDRMDATVGGSYHAAFTDIGTGHSHSFGGEYLELNKDERLRYSAVFDDPQMPGTMQTTVTLKAVSCGTEVHIEQSGIPAMIPAEQCYLGWQQSLILLGLLVEEAP
jgi:uncharacterized protein YndB with AHSA1/START domain